MRLRPCPRLTPCPDVLSGTPLANDTAFAELFATGGQFDGLHVPEAEAWRDQARDQTGANVDPLTDLGATDAVENAVRWLEEAMLAAGEKTLRAEIKALPETEQAALLALISIDDAFDDSDAHVNAIIDVLADGLYLSNKYGLTFDADEIEALRPIVTETDPSQLSDLLDDLESAEGSLVETIFDTSGETANYDASSDSDRAYVLSVIRDGSFFESAISTATLNRLMAAYSTGAETVVFGADTGGARQRACGSIEKQVACHSCNRRGSGGQTAFLAVLGHEGDPRISKAVRRFWVE